MSKEKEMTELEAKEVYEKIAGKLKLRFVAYYKYSFTFVGEYKNVKVCVAYGGNADDIYKLEVKREAFEAPPTFRELMYTYYFVVIETPDKRFESCR